MKFIFVLLKKNLISLGAFPKKIEMAGGILSLSVLNDQLLQKSICFWKNLWHGVWKAF